MRQAFIQHQLNWLSVHGEFIRNCEFNFDGTIISFSKHSTGVWYYGIG